MCGGGDRWRSGEIGELEDAGAQRVWEHNACVQPTSSAVLAGAGKQGDDCVGEDSRRCSVRVEMRAGEAKSKGVPHSWTLAHLAMRHASGSAAANAWLHRAGVGCGSCVLEIVVSSRPVTFTRVHTRQVCSDHTALRARAVLSTLGPRPSIRSSGHRSQVASQRSDHPYAAPWSTRRARRALLECARSLSRRALSRCSLPSLSIVGLSSSFALSLLRLPQPRFAAAADAGSGAALIWHFFWWRAKSRLASRPLKTAPQQHAAPTAQQALAWVPEQ